MITFYGRPKEEPFLIFLVLDLLCYDYQEFELSRISPFLFLKKKARDKIYGASIFSRAAAIKNYYCGCVMQLSRGPKRNLDGGPIK
jgi:hypothetical protein